MVASARVNCAYVVCAGVGVYAAANGAAGVYAGVLVVSDVSAAADECSSASE